MNFGVLKYRNLKYAKTSIDNKQVYKNWTKLRQMHSLAFKLLVFNSYWEREAYIWKQISSRICNALSKYWFSSLFSWFSIRRSPVRVETFCRPQTRRHLANPRTTSQPAHGPQWFRPKTCTVCLKTTKISWNVFHLYGLNVWQFFQ